HVDNGIDPFLPEQGFDQLPVADISVHEAGATRDRSTVSRAQVVEHENTQSPIEKLIYDDAPMYPAPPVTRTRRVTRAAPSRTGGVAPRAGHTRGLLRRPPSRRPWADGGTCSR